MRNTVRRPVQGFDSLSGGASFHVFGPFLAGEYVRSVRVALGVQAAGLTNQDGTIQIRACNVRPASVLSADFGAGRRLTHFTPAGNATPLPLSTHSAVIDVPTEWTASDEERFLVVYLGNTTDSVVGFLGLVMGPPLLGVNADRTEDRTDNPAA